MVHDWAWLNGQWVAASQLAIPAWDAGFVYAATVTDLCRTIGHRLFLWDKHLQRFLASAELCEVPIAYSATELTNVAKELVQRQTARLASWQDLALVTFATPGPVGQYRPFSAGTPQSPTSIEKDTPTLGMHTFQLPLARYAQIWRDGFHLASVPVAPPDSALPRRAKHRSRLHWWRAQRQAERLYRGAIALLCEADGALLETAFANLVLVIGDTLATPPPNRVLPGISWQYVAELAHALGWHTEYRMLYFHDVLLAEEAFLTSSSFCLLPVRQIDSKTFACPGPKTTRLLEAWSESVHFDLLGQLSAAPAASDPV